MSFNIGVEDSAFGSQNSKVIDDSGYTGPNMGGVFGDYDSNSNLLAGVSSGHNLYFNSSTQVVEITAPAISYSSGRSSIILNMKNTDTDDNAVQHIYLKINGNRTVKGYKKTTGTDIGYVGVANFSSSNRGMAQAFDISSDGLNWYFGHDQDNTIYHFTNTVPWGVSTISSSSSFDHSSYVQCTYDSGSSRVYKALRVSEDGKKMYIFSRAEGSQLKGKIDQFTLNTPYSLSSVTHDSSFFPKISIRSYNKGTTAFSNDLDSTTNSVLNFIDFDRDGKRVLVANEYGQKSAVLLLDSAWDLSKYTTETMANYSAVGTAGSGQGIGESRLDKDGRTLRVYRTSGIGSGYGEARSWRWKTPWTLYETFDSSFDYKKSETPNSGSRIYESWHMRPGGHHFIGTLNYVLGDRLYKVNTQDSSGSVGPAPLIFPPNVNFQDGVAPEMPDSGEELWLELLSFDSGNNWYAKKIYGG